MAGMACLSSWSGGKDSALACYKAMRMGYDVRYLLNFVSRESGRGCFHGIEGALLKAQADAIGIPIVQKETTADMSKYEEEFKDAVSSFSIQGIRSMVFGDIYLLEHSSWVERVCGEIGVMPVNPLWNRPVEAIFEEFIDLGFEATIISCKADPLGKEFIGRCLTKAMIREFKDRGVCPCGENGEYHTLVTDGPLFKKRIEIIDSEPIVKEGFWKHYFLNIKKYKIGEKVHV